MSPALAPSRSVSRPASSLRESWAVRAASLWERAAGRTLPASQASSGSAESVVGDRRTAWTRALGDDPTRLSRRRAVGSLCTVPLSRLLAPAARWVERPLPAWTELLQTATQEAPRLASDAAAGSLVDPARPSDDGPPIPYHDLLMPFVRIAQRRLRARIGAWDDWHPDARAGLDRALLQRLSQVSRYVFQVKFSAHRAFHGGGTSGTDRYRQFVAAHLDDGLDTVFDDYPVLGRLMAERTRDWIDATAELVLRVRRDRQCIAEALLGNPPPGPVVQVDAACSDPHRHGRGVALLTFACGRRLVYKPRSLAPDVALARLVRDWSDRGFPASLRVPASLPCCDDAGDYGWQAFVPAQPCSSTADVTRYYRRCGAWLAVMHVLGGRDFHGENLIASGAHPVPVDGEMVTAPRLARRHHLVPDTPSARAFEHTVLETGFLPWQRAGRGGHDVSGLGAEAEQTVRHLRWAFVNTDRMIYGRVEAPVTHPFQNVAFRPDGTRVAPARFLDAIAEGVSDTYRHFFHHRDAVQDDVDRHLASIPVRYLLRDTRTYGAVLHAATHPSALRDGVAYSLVMERLCTGLLGGRPTEALWAAVHAEIQSLHRGDIPLLSAVTDDTALYLEDGTTVDGFFERSCRARIHHRLEGLSELDLHAQTTLLRAAFVGRDGAPPLPSPGLRVEPLADLREAGDQLRRAAGACAIRPFGADAPVWITHAYDARQDAYPLQPVDASLHSGHCGLGLWDAARYRVTGDRTARAHALRTLRGVTARMGDSTAADLRRITPSLGGTTGWGGLLYVLALAGDWLHAPDLHCAAHIAACELASWVEDADEPDAGTGLAGLLLGLLALDAGAPSPDVRAAANRTGTRLLALQHDDGVWAHPDGSIFWGMAHGVAGIAMALARWAQTRPLADARTARQASARGWMAVAHAYDASVGNWPRTRGDIAQDAERGWCHGAPGIGRAAAATRHTLGDDARSFRTQLARIEAQAVASVDDSEATPVCGRDHLCCGAFGRLPLAFGDARTAQVASLVRRAHRRDGYRSVLNGDAATMPGFFVGAAGIGYELLRTTAPDTLPDVLQWQTPFAS